MELLDWIDIKKLSWRELSGNPNKNKKAFAFLFHNNKKNERFFSWNAIPLLEANPDKINWFQLSRNPNAMYLLEAHPDTSNNHYPYPKNKIYPQDKNNIHWHDLSKNPNAISLLEANQEKIDWIIFE